MQIIDPHNEVTHYWDDIEPNLRAIDIWIGEESHLANGYGTEMMRQAIELCFALPAVTAIIIDPLSNNLRAINFYRKLGFLDWYEGDFEEDHCLGHAPGANWPLKLKRISAFTNLKKIGCGLEY